MQPLFRSVNPLGASLAQSSALFTLRVDGMTDVPDVLADECARIGATCRIVRASERDNAHGTDVLEVRASHSVMDAFAGMYLLSRIDTKVHENVTRTEGDHIISGILDGYVFHTYVERIEARHDERTVAQRVLGEILERAPELRDGPVAICTSRDSLGAIERNSYTGNSLVLVEMSGAAATRLAAGSRDTWAHQLRTQADRVAALAMRRPGLLRSSALFLFSAMGDTRRFPWTDDLVHPSSLSLVSSPATPASANIACWSSGAFQSLNLCGSPEHPVIRNAERIAAGWRDALRSIS
ncbi:hypothetical protein LZC95_01375 [Pendulispora brunnea]|uniref:Uncharacterized protein n=1 Tax=Pendulispora brunnea TaxID=2905690 RepID=A0ABZ2K9Y3_9BACT